MSVNHSPPFFFTSFILNFHQFPLFFFKKYLIGKYLSSCIISPGVVRTSECVCAFRPPLAGVHPTRGRAQPMAVERYLAVATPSSFFFVQHRPSGSEANTKVIPVIITIRHHPIYKMLIHLTHYKCVSSFFLLCTQNNNISKIKRSLTCLLFAIS